MSSARCCSVNRSWSSWLTSRTGSTASKSWLISTTGVPPIPADATVSLGYSVKDMPQR